MRIFISLFSIIWLVSCASSAPEWVRELSSDYPEKRYLSAVGSGEDSDTADNRARAGIAQIFESVINDQSADFSSVETSKKPDYLDQQTIQRASRAVAVFSDQTIEGIKIVKRDREDQGTYYSLAVLEKEPAAARLSKKISNLDRETKNLWNASQSTSQTLKPLMSLQQALNLQIERKAAYAHFLILTEKPHPPQYSIEKIRQAIRSQFNKLSVAVQAEDGNVLSALESAVTRLEMRVVAKNQTNLSIKASVDTEPVFQNDGWFWLRGSIEVNLRQRVINIGQKRQAIKISARSASLLEKRRDDFLDKNMSKLIFEMMTRSSLSENASFE